jgi:hypothetical protein
MRRYGLLVLTLVALSFGAACGGDSDDGDDGDGDTAGATATTAAATEPPANSTPAAATESFADFSAAMQEDVDAMCTWADGAADASVDTVTNPPAGAADALAMQSGELGDTLVPYGEPLADAINASDKQAIIDVAGDISSGCDEIGWTAS